MTNDDASDRVLLEAISNAETVEAARKATLAARVRRFVTPHMGINSHELLELLGLMFPRALTKLTKTGGTPRGVRRIENHLGVKTNLFWLSDRTEFAAWFSDFAGVDLPDWFLEEPDAMQALGMLVSWDEER